MTRHRHVFKKPGNRILHVSPASVASVNTQNDSNLAVGLGRQEPCGFGSWITLVLAGPGRKPHAILITRVFPGEPFKGAIHRPSNRATPNREVFRALNRAVVSQKPRSLSLSRDGSHNIASSRRSFRQSILFVNSQRESIESKRDGLMAFDKSVCAEFWDSIGSKKISRFWTIVAEEWVHGAESKSLSTHGLWSATFPAFQQKERASENKDTYLPRDREQVHRFLLNGNWTSKEEVGGGGWVSGCEARCWKSNWLTTWRSTWAIMSRDSLRKLSKLASGKVCMCTFSLES